MYDVYWLVDVNNNHPIINDNWGDRLLKRLFKDVRTNAEWIIGKQIVTQNVNDICTINAKYKISIGRAKKKLKKKTAWRQKGTVRIEFTQIR